MLSIADVPSNRVVATSSADCYTLASSDREGTIATRQYRWPHSFGKFTTSYATRRDRACREIRARRPQLDCSWRFFLVMTM